MKQLKKIIFLAELLFTIPAVLLFSGAFPGLSPYIVLSGSMEPAVHVGSICLLHTGASYEALRVGDIVGYGVSGQIAAHRVIAITPEGLETKGDANEFSDGISVTEENFRGRVIGSIPALGKGIVFLRTTAGRLILAGLLALWLLPGFFEGKEKSERTEK